jgi:hypothetical protein
MYQNLFIDHLKDPEDPEEKLILEGIEAFKNFQQWVTTRSCGQP